MTHYVLFLLRLKVLKDELKKPYFIALKEFLWKEGVHGPDDSADNLKVYPARKLTLGHVRALLWLLMHAEAARNIYSWSNYTPLGKVRVVMIGQDPYHGPGQAHGMSRRLSLAVFPAWPVDGLLTDPPALSCCRSLLFGPARCFSASILEKCSVPCLSLTILLPQPPSSPSRFDSCHS